jgi:hypothetical protein
MDAGTVTILDQVFPKQLLVSDGRSRAVYYNNGQLIRAGEVEFSMVLSDTSTDANASLPDGAMDQADRIVQSLEAVTSAEPPEGGPIAPVAEADCTDSIAFVEDVTVPDGTEIPVDDDFEKTWRVRNTGTCTWDATYAVVFASGSAMGASETQRLDAVVAPNATVDISIAMTSPAQPGSYTGVWRLQDPAGTDVQPTNLIVVIQAIEGESSAPAVEPTATAAGSDMPQEAAAVLAEGSVSMAYVQDLPTCFDLDGNLAGQGLGVPGCDFALQPGPSDQPQSVSFVPLSSAAFAFGQAAEPSKADCQAASLGGGPQIIVPAQAGYTCYRTSEGRIGYLYFAADALDSAAGLVRGSFRTFE